MNFEQIDGYFLFVQGIKLVNPFEPKVAIDKLRASFPRVEIQFLRADMIAGIEHIRFATKNAISAFNGPRRKTKSLAVELLLYISCQRQISKAISILGIRSNDPDIVLIGLAHAVEDLEKLSSAIRSVFDGEMDDTVLEPRSASKRQQLMRVYGVTEKELDAAKELVNDEVEALKRLVIERSALLSFEG